MVDEDFNTPECEAFFRRMVREIVLIVIVAFVLVYAFAFAIASGPQIDRYFKERQEKHTNKNLK